MFKYVLCLLLFVLGVNSNAALHRHCSTVNGEYVCAYLDEKEIDALNKISKRKNSNYSNATQNSKDYTSSDAKSSIVYSCNLGNSVNCFSLGWNYENGVNGYTKDYSKAIEFYRKSCNLNNGRGCNNLGDLYYNGNGVDKDYDVAFYLFEKACKLNSEYGCFSLGKMYADGKGTLQDYQKAKSHYNKSCQLGYKVACNINLNNNSSDSNISNKDQSSQRQDEYYFSLGWSYANGENGYTKDYSKAIDYYRKACDLDYGPACNNLGVLYANGEGINKNVPIARIYYDKACKLNNEIGCSNLRNNGSVTGSTNDYKRVYVSPIVYIVLIPFICGCIWFIYYVLEDMCKILPDFTVLVIIILALIVLGMMGIGIIKFIVYVLKEIWTFVSGVF